jgi:hypothetical protein
MHCWGKVAAAAALSHYSHRILMSQLASMTPAEVKHEQAWISEHKKLVNNMLEAPCKHHVDMHCTQKAFHSYFCTIKGRLLQTHLHLINKRHLAMLMTSYLHWRVKHAKGCGNSSTGAWRLGHICMQLKEYIIE